MVAYKEMPLKLSLISNQPHLLFHKAVSLSLLFSCIGAKKKKISKHGGGKTDINAYVPTGNAKTGYECKNIEQCFIHSVITDLLYVTVIIKITACNKSYRA